MAITILALCIPLPMWLLQVHINVKKLPESIISCLCATPEFTCAIVQFGNTLLLVMQITNVGDVHHRRNCMNKCRIADQIITRMQKSNRINNEIYFYNWDILFKMFDGEGAGLFLRLLLSGTDVCLTFVETSRTAE